MRHQLLLFYCTLLFRSLGFLSPSLLSIEIINLTAFTPVKCCRFDVRFSLTPESYPWMFNMWETFVIITVAATKIMEKHCSVFFVSFIWFRSLLFAHANMTLNAVQWNNSSASKFTFNLATQLLFFQFELSFLHGYDALSDTFTV